MKQSNTYVANQKGSILLNANESDQNLDTVIVEAIKDAMNDIEFHRYPEDSNKAIRQAYANIISKDVEEVLCGNGSDEMLGLIISLFIAKGKKLYTLSPDFSMYDYYVGMHDGIMEKYIYGIDDEFDVEAFIQQGKKQDVNLIIFSNPNNPTGKIIPQNELKQILSAFSDIPVVIDEAYADFCEESMLDEISNYDNLYITRTLSKAYAMAGLRCGYIISNKKNIAYLKKYKVPYNVNVLTQKVVEIALSYQSLFQKRIEKVKQNRRLMYEAYKTIESSCITLYPSYANYFYGTTNTPLFYKLLEEKDITIRKYSDSEFRITVSSEVQNQMILDIIEQVSKGDAQ